MAVFKGIDVSKWQKKIDWAKVKADFVIIRAGYANSDGTITEDEFFKTNMQGSAAAGIPAGVYLYTYITNVNAAKITAKNLLDMVKPYKVELPLVLDFENEKFQAGTKKGNAAVIAAALDVWEKAGYYAMWYTYKAFANTHVDCEALKKYDFWLAHYTAKTDYSRPYGIWQYSSKGKVAGISGNVDMNYSYKDYPKIIREKGLNRLGKKDILFDDISAMECNLITKYADSIGVKYTVKEG